MQGRRGRHALIQTALPSTYARFSARPSSNSQKKQASSPPTTNMTNTQRHPPSPVFPLQTDPKREKELTIDQSVNEAVLNSKIYCDLKHSYLEAKQKNAQHKQAMVKVPLIAARK